MRWNLGSLWDGEPGAAGGGLPPGAPPPPPDVDVAKLVAQVEKQGQAIENIVGAIRNIPAASAPSPRPQETKPDDVKAIEAEFWKNPVQVAQALSRQAAAEGIAAAANNNPALDTLVLMARDSARKKDEKIFDLLATEIETKVNSLPPQFRQSASAWTNAFNMAVGENMERVVAERQKANPPAAAPAVAGGPLPPSPRQADPPRTADLSVEEKDFCRRFGVSEDGYRRGKKAYAEQGSGRPNETSSWDGVMTFDSNVKKMQAREAKRKANASAK